MQARLFVSCKRCSISSRVNAISMVCSVFEFVLPKLIVSPVVGFIDSKLNCNQRATRIREERIFKFCKEMQRAKAVSSFQDVPKLDATG